MNVERTVSSGQAARHACTRSSVRRPAGRFISFRIGDWRAGTEVEGRAAAAAGRRARLHHEFDEVGDVRVRVDVMQAHQASSSERPRQSFMPYGSLAAPRALGIAQVDDRRRGCPATTTSSSRTPPATRRSASRSTSSTGGDQVAAHRREVQKCSGGCSPRKSSGRRSARRELTRTRSPPQRGWRGTRSRNGSRPRRQRRVHAHSRGVVLRAADRQHARMRSRISSARVAMAAVTITFAVLGQWPRRSRPATRPPRNR